MKDLLISFAVAGILFAILWYPVTHMIVYIRYATEEENFILRSVIAIGFLLFILYKTLTARPRPNKDK